MNVEATPGEIVDILNKVGTSQPTATAWLTSAANSIHAENVRTAAFRRQRISAWVDLYVAPSSAGKKSLLIGFTGRNHKISCPIFSLLQATPDETYDILILRDPGKKNFLNGIDGHADSLIAVLEWISERFLGNYRDVRILGASGGGFAALVAGRYFQSSRVISASGFLLNAVSRRTDQEVSERVETQDRVLSLMNDHAAVRSICLVASGSERDKSKGRDLAFAFDSKLVAIEGAYDHAVLYELTQDAKLGATLRKLLFSDDEIFDRDEEIARGVIKSTWSRRMYETRISELQAEIKALKLSGSWRITKPLRALNDLKSDISDLWFQGGARHGRPSQNNEAGKPVGQSSRISRSDMELRGNLVLPATPLEIHIVQLFAEQFKIDVVGATDDFFDLGGDSLAAEAIIMAINESATYKVQVSDLFENSTPRKIAQLIERGELVVTN